jgi:hypothetical protein
MDESSRSEYTNEQADHFYELTSTSGYSLEMCLASGSRSGYSNLYMVCLKDKRTSLDLNQAMKDFLDNPQKALKSLEESVAVNEQVLPSVNEQELPSEPLTEMQKTPPAQNPPKACDLRPFHVTHLVSPDEIWVRPEWLDKQYQSFQAQVLQELSQKKDDKPLRLGDVSVGQCVALWSSKIPTREYRCCHKGY